MTTNILSLPLIPVTAEIGTNEDWRDGWMFIGAGSAVAYAQPANVGNGTVGTITVATGAPLGSTLVEILTVGASTIFGVTGPDGSLLGIGTVGAPFNAGGFAFTITQGGTAFAVGDAFTIATIGTSIDLTGIAFTLSIRQTVDATRVFLTASTANSLLVNDGTTLVVAIPQATIKQKLKPGAYVFDVVAHGDSIDRRVITGTVNVVYGISFSS